MAAFRRLLDISADFTITYRPQSNEIVERKNLNVLTHLRALLTTSLDVTTNWCSLLPIAQRICNATDVNSIGCAPAQIIYGNLIHLNRGLDTSFTPPLPNSWRHCLSRRFVQGSTGTCHGISKVSRICQGFSRCGTGCTTISHIPYRISCPRRLPYRLSA
jgi:hypothetical protein